MGYAKDAVKFAEQLNIGGLIDAQGRKQAAVQYVQNWLDSKGIKDVNVAQIEAAVELAVFTELKKDGVVSDSTVTTTTVVTPTTPDTKEVG